MSAFTDDDARERLTPELALVYPELARLARTSVPKGADVEVDPFGANAASPMTPGEEERLPATAEKRRVLHPFGYLTASSEVERAQPGSPMRQRAARFMVRFMLGLALLALFFLGALSAGAGDQASMSSLSESASRISTTTHSFLPSADAYVSRARPRHNFGSSRTLRVGAAPVRRAYLRFNLRSLTGTVSRATLRLYAVSGSGDGYAVRLARSNRWGEHSLNYANAPRFLRAWNRSGSFRAGTWTSVDVTGLVRAGGRLSLVLTSPDRGRVRLGSRENVGHRPRLVIQSNPPTIFLKADAEGPITSEFGQIDDGLHCHSAPVEDANIHKSRFSVQGSYSWVFEHFPSDPDCFSRRSEAVVGDYSAGWPYVHRFKEGDDVWQAFQVYLPSAINGTDYTYWISTTQTSKAYCGGSPRGHLAQRQGKWMFMEGERPDYIADLGSTGHVFLSDSNVASDVWLKFSIHTYYNVDNTKGFVKMYGDLRDGQGFRLLMPKHFGSTNGYCSDGSIARPMVRVGLYPHPSFPNIHFVEYIDGLTISDSRAAAEANAFGG